MHLQHYLSNNMWTKTVDLSWMREGFLASGPGGLIMRVLKHLLLNDIDKIKNSLILQYRMCCFCVHHVSEEPNGEPRIFLTCKKDGETYIVRHEACKENFKLEKVWRLRLEKKLEALSDG